MLVELHIYSGRLDPRQRLTADETFNNIIAKLNPYYGEYLFPQRLGYRGFTVLNQQDGQSWDEIHVFREYVLIKSRKQNKYYIDSDKKLENYLLDSFKGIVKDVVLQSIRTEER